MDANGTHLTRIVADQPAVFFSDWGSQPQLKPAATKAREPIG
jgi:hypothetical protein